MTQGIGEVNPAPVAVKPSIEEPDHSEWDAWIEEVQIEDGKPVESIFAEKQYRLLTEALHASWTPPGGEPFLVLANVGLFSARGIPPLVPDVMLALGVTFPFDSSRKEYNSYFMYVVGKSPDVVIEIVSATPGGEDTEKLKQYANIHVPYYVIFDPEEHLKKGVLRGFRLVGKRYEECDPHRFEDTDLGLVLWEGKYEGLQKCWLRWCDRDGELIATGKERADAQQHRADDQQKRAEDQQKRADDQQKRADRLAAKLREMGVDPDAV